MSSLTADAVRALAPDAGVLKSGQSLANGRHWSSLGRSERAAWGRCQGSGKEPYSVMVDVDGAAAKCTCPSRKFPCKHGIGLMLLAAAGSVGQSGTEPDDVAAWLNDRTRRAAAAAERTSAAPGAPARDGRARREGRPRPRT